VCLGYPFHPPNKAENTRLEPLTARLQSVLILQGELDKLGDKKDIASYVLSNLCRIIFFPDGDHDLKPRVKSGYTHEQHLASAVEHIVEYIRQEVKV